MLHKGFALGLVLFAGLSASAAEPVKSGPQPGSKVPGPFKPLNVNGPDAGKEECLYCKNGTKPVVMMFVRELTPTTVTLIKKLEGTTALQGDGEVGTCVIVLSDAKDLAPQLAKWASAEKITTTMLATYAPAGPEKYTIAADAAVTVLMYSKFTVRANHSFRAGELTDAGVATVLADLAKIQPSK